MRTQSLQTLMAKHLGSRSALCLVLFYARKNKTHRDHGHAVARLFHRPVHVPEKGRDEKYFAGRMRRSAEGWKAIGDAEQEDQSNRAAIHRAGPCNDVIQPGMMTASIECSTNRSGHQRIHGNQA